MNKLITLIAVTALVTACGGNGPESGGSLTLPPTETTAGPTTTEAPAATTTIPAGPTGSTTATAPTTTTPGPTTTTDAADRSPVTVTVYFLNDAGQAVATERTVRSEGVARAAVEVLIDGPDASEAAAGLSSAVPVDSLVLGLTIDDGLATIDMSREFEAGGGSFSITGRLAQLVYSLTEFSSVDRVRLLLDGDRVETFSSEGFVMGEALVPTDFSGSVPVGPSHDSANVSTWDQDDLDSVTPGDPDVYRVVLVAGDDTLNVRAEAGVDGDLIGRLLPGVGIRVTGETREVGSSTWRQIESPAGPGWVNGFYLGRSVAGDDFPGDDDPLAVVAELADRMANGEDFTDLVSERGLWVAHHAHPIRFAIEEIAGLADDATTYRWGSNALEPDSPELRPRTFAQAVIDPFVSTYDTDRQVRVNQFIEGPNGRPAQVGIPIEFRGFGFVTVYDAADNPEYGGLDWMSWVVSLDYEDDELKVVGLTIDQWAP